MTDYNTKETPEDNTMPTHVTQVQHIGFSKTKMAPVDMDAGPGTSRSAN